MASPPLNLVSRLKVLRNEADGRVKASLRRHRWGYAFDQAHLRDLLDDTIQHLEGVEQQIVAELVFE